MALSAVFGGNPLIETNKRGNLFDDEHYLPIPLRNLKDDQAQAQSEFDFKSFQPTCEFFNPDVMKVMCEKMTFSPTDQLSQKIETISLQEQRSHPKFQLLHGTTTMGFIYQGGVMVAVDSRASGGTAIFSYSVNKVIPISKYLLGTMAGGAADCTYWMRVLSRQVRMYELKNREIISVAAASKILINMLYQYKNYGISVGSMVAGYDKSGPGLFLVTNEGLRAKGNIFSVGSGSPYALGVLDNGYKFDMKDEEAYKLARRSIFEAGRRDIASGGFVSVYRITADGWTRLSVDDISEVYHNEKKTGLMDY